MSTNSKDTRRRIENMGRPQTMTVDIRYKVFLSAKWVFWCFAHGHGHIAR
jgi:hypothetical protein